LAYIDTWKNYRNPIVSFIPLMQLKMLVSHEGEEFMDTVEGIHKFIYNNKKCMLNKGDSIYSPSPECPARKGGDEWRGEPSEALAKEG
jgi:hypothetical protein